MRLTVTTKLEATGQSDFVPEDRRAIFATPRPGNTDVVELQLQYIDPEDGEEKDLGQYRLADLVKVVQEASQKILDLEAKFSGQEQARSLELLPRPTGLEL